jgi:hypothetical protein
MTDFFCGANVPTYGECLHDQCINSKEQENKCSITDRLRVWARFDVETSDPYAFFLPRHYALSLLQDFERIMSCIGIPRWNVS